MEVIMKRFNALFQKSVTITLAALFICSSYSVAEQVWEEEGSDLVARITVIEGRLERFDSETQEWVVTVVDAPVGNGDQLFAGVGARVEVLIPNNTMLRMGGETEARFISLTETLTEIDIFSGTARLYNNSSQADIIATTQFGRIEIPSGASVDLNIDDEAVEIFPLEDTVYFTGNRSSGRHEIIAGSDSLMAYSDRVMPSRGSVDRSWHAWNRDRDALWAERGQTAGESRDYLPVSLHDEAYILNTHGSWYRVYYEGDYYRFWRPRYVDVGWSPFSVGMWMTWRGDRVWIPREPFGYITHHYGNWINAHGTWYWAPPVSRAIVRSGLPLLNIGFNWYPGRVAWIDAGIHMSWMALAPFEPFYCRYPWGYRSIVIANGPYPRYVASHKFKYRRHTVRGSRDHFYRNKRGVHVSKWSVARRSDAYNQKGSHVSRWRTARRSDTHVSPSTRNRDRNDSRYFRSEGESKRGDKVNRNESRIREPRRSEERPSRDRGKYVGAMEKKHDDVRNRDGNRRPIAVTNDNAVSAVPERNRRPNNQATERRRNSSNDRNRIQSSAENVQRSGSRNRSSAVRTDRNTPRTGDRTRRPR